MATSSEINYRLIANVRDEPKQMLQPIAGYEKEPLLSLEDACKPLENIVNEELQQNIMIAKINSKESINGLSQDESASIHLYTMEWTEHENSLYAVLNRTLRMVDRRKLRPWFKYLKLLLTALFKLPSSGHRIVYRGVPEDLHDRFSKGENITWWAFSSCTSSISVLESPDYVGTSGTRTMFNIETSSGKFIQLHSYFRHEDEILLPPGIHFQVVDKFSPNKGLYIIHLRETPPPFKLLADPFDLSQIKTALPESTPSSNMSSIEKKQEHGSPSAPSKLTEYSTAKKEKLPIDVPKKNSPYSDKKLRCNGCACAKCGHCRDWYWRPDGSDKKHYTKRSDASCTFGFPGGPDPYGGRDRRYHYGGFFGLPLCECHDNRV